VKVHISHLKGTTEQEVQEVLAYLDQARREVDLSYDVYPYLRGSTMLNFLFPYEIWEDGPLSVLSKLSRSEVRARFQPCLETKHYPLEGITIAWSAAPNGHELAGKSIGDLVNQSGRPVEEVLIDLLIESNLATLLVLGPREDQVIEPLLAHDLGMLGSDGIYFPGGHVHPRVFGSVGRWLGLAVREHKVTTLEAAVHKMSGKSAVRFGLAGRGVVREGAFADLVVFDPATIRDRATYDEPRQTCVGIDHVLVNGVPVVEGATPIDKLPSALPGRSLRYER
jgi:N-acyl-D-amino-acid deacylase